MERTDNRGPKYKLTEAQHEEIKQRYKSEPISQAKLAKDYGVSQGTISRIISPITAEKMRESCLRRYYRLKEIRNESTV